MTCTILVFRSSQQLLIKWWSPFGCLHCTVSSSVMCLSLTQTDWNAIDEYVNTVPACYVGYYASSVTSVKKFHPNAYRQAYTGCPRRNVPEFGRVFLMLNYTDITQNTYIQSWTVTEIMAREVWNFDSCYTLIDYQIHIETGRNM